MRSICSFAQGGRGLACDHKGASAEKGGHSATEGPTTHMGYDLPCDDRIVRRPTARWVTSFLALGMAFLAGLTTPSAPSALGGPASGLPGAAMSPGEEAYKKKYCKNNNTAEPSLWPIRYVRKTKDGKNVMTRILQVRINDMDPSDGSSGSCEPYERKPRDFLVWRVQGPRDGRVKRVSPIVRITLEDGRHHGTVFYSDPFRLRASPPKPGIVEKVRIRERHYPKGEKAHACTITHNTYPWASRFGQVPACMSKT
jgi:hypothetical protein